MTTTSSNNQAKQSKREMILEIAAPLFSANDFHEVNMELVAKKAEISKGTIYNYFKSKEDLYFSIIYSRLSKLINELQKKIDEQVSVLEDLNGLILHVFMFMMKYQNFFLLFQRTRLKLQASNHNEIENKMSQLKEMLSNILKEGIKTKVFRQVDPCLTSDIILGIIYSTVQRNIGKDLYDDILVGERQYLVDFIKDGILTPELDKSALNGKTILLTRTLGQSEESALTFTSRGAEVITVPTLKIVPPSSWKKCDEAINELKTFDSIIFASANAVKWFVKRLYYHELKIDFDLFNIIAVGPKTEAECLSNGIHVNLVPKEFSSSGVLKEIDLSEVKGKKFLIPQSEIGRDELSIALCSKGAIVNSVPVYDIAISEVGEIQEAVLKMQNGNIDVFVFTSPSSFNNYLKIFDVKEPAKYFENEVIAAIGPTTKNAIESFGVDVKILPIEHTIEGLVNSVINYFKKAN